MQVWGPKALRKISMSVSQAQRRTPKGEEDLCIGFDSDVSFPYGTDSGGAALHLHEWVQTCSQLCLQCTQMLCEQGRGCLAVDLGLLNICPEMHSQQHCQPQPWGLPSLGKGHHVHTNALGSTGATSPLCWPSIQARCSLCNTHI